MHAYAYRPSTHVVLLQRSALDRDKCVDREALRVLGHATDLPDQTYTVLVLLTKAENATRADADAGFADSLDGSDAVVVRASRDDFWVELARCVQVVVVGAQSGFLEPTRLVGREHAEGRAHCCQKNVSRQHSPSMPIPRTSLTIVRIFSKPDLRPARSRHAAPMQKRVEPLALALRAASSTGSIWTRRLAVVGVLYDDDCEQYLQSSVHPPAERLAYPWGSTGSRFQLRKHYWPITKITVHSRARGSQGSVRRNHSSLTLDVHEGAQLDAAGVVMQAVDASSTEDGLHQRAIEDLLDLRPLPVVADIGGQCGDRRWARVNSDGVPACQHWPGERHNRACGRAKRHCAMVRCRCQEDKQINALLDCHARILTIVAWMIVSRCYTHPSSFRHLLRRGQDIPRRHYFGAWGKVRWRRTLNNDVGLPL